MMKKYFMTLSAIVYGTMATQAQSSWTDCFTVSKIVVQTTNAQGQDYIQRGTIKDSLLVGIESFTFVMNSIESTSSLWKELELPENTLAKLSVTNLYKDFQWEGKHDLIEIFKRAKTGLVKKFNIVRNFPFLIGCGGEYECILDINALNYKETKNLTIYGTAGFDFKDDKTINCGKDTVLRVTCNTGYPYDYSSLKGDEYAKATVYRINDDDTETELHSHEISLPFKQANQPLMAQIDTLYIGFEKPEVGKYRVHLESNWEGLKERSAIITVVDPSATGVNAYEVDSTDGRNKDENTYTLNGVKVGKGAKQPKGIYIRKGRKYINR
ncbi:MAG: hypothetical protein IJV09_03325 [Prevotella sp.]|nr:hypothetical protein [Prevotella sp.]